MKWTATLIAMLQLLVWSAAGSAQDHVVASSANRTVSTTTWVEEWDDADQRWVRVSGETKTTAVERKPRANIATTRTYQAARYAVPVTSARPATAQRRPAAIGQYGPFVVLDAGRAAMIGSTDSASPQHFDAMLRDHPGLRVLEMIEAPGTSNDIANLAVGRRIREAGLSTHVPSGGSVRSGAVELFLAGKERRIDDGAQFAVHSWLDNYGRQPADFAPDAPENRLYLDYYREMGMSDRQARSFYSMTNSVPHSSAKWLNAEAMRGWISAPAPTPRIYAKSDWAIAALDPRALTPVDVPITPIVPATVMWAEVVPAPTASSPVAPSISYGDLAALTLADTVPQIALAKSHAFLDS